MADDYTLTPEQLRSGREAYRASGTPMSLARWLAAHDAEVREHARHVFCDRRLGCVVAEEPEWEYGVEHVQVDGWVERELHLNRQEALDDYRTCGMNCTLMRRRKAGPWVPVKQEGAETDG